MITRAEKNGFFAYIDNVFWTHTLLDRYGQGEDELWNTGNYFLTLEEAAVMNKRFHDLIDEIHPEIKGWRAEKGGTYYCIMFEEMIVWETTDEDERLRDCNNVAGIRHKNRNYFPTKEIADEMLDKFQALLKEHKGKEVEI
ncbi:MAG: hypothetical protein MJZ76_09505 [Bacteroidales bacterium]|nr:hypothetical protein [Bacteroidales bacterium]